MYTSCRMNTKTFKQVSFDWHYLYKSFKFCKWNPALHVANWFIYWWHKWFWKCWRSFQGARDYQRSNKVSIGIRVWNYWSIGGRVNFKWRSHLEFKLVKLLDVHEYFHQVTGITCIILAGFASENLGMHVWCVFVTYFVFRNSRDKYSGWRAQTLVGCSPRPRERFGGPQKLSEFGGHRGRCFCEIFEVCLIGPKFDGAKFA